MTLRENVWPYCAARGDHASALFDSLSNDRFTGFKPSGISDGVVQGIAGVVTMPVAGLMDLGASTMQVCARCGSLFNCAFLSVLNVAFHAPWFSLHHAAVVSLMACIS